jgi:hypothetical protein
MKPGNSCKVAPAVSALKIAHRASRDARSMRQVYAVARRCAIASAIGWPLACS